MSQHFLGKDVYSHLKQARQRGAKVFAEVHGTEAPGYLIAASDSAKNTSIILLSFWILLTAFNCSSPLMILSLFSFGWMLWKIGRSSLLGWNRLERLHRLIEQERWEIQHHRAQEKEELRAMYAQKGFSGPLLDQAVEVMMADDNRLLRVMLEEELGLTLESYEHPLKQAMGAGIGTLMTSAIGLLGGWAFGFWGIFSSIFIIFSSATIFMALREGNQLIKAFVWNFAVGTLVISSIHFISKALG